MVKLKKFNVWIELEKTIKAKNQQEAEDIFNETWNPEDVTINSCETKNE